MTCPAVALSEDAPLYHRPMAQPGDHAARAADDPGSLAAPDDCGADIMAMVSDPSWVYRQYDHQLFLNTVEGPGGDAAVLRLAAPGLPPSDKGLALTTDSNPTWCSIDPRAGTAATVAEGGTQRGLRRRPAHGRRQLPQLRQPGASRGDVAAVRSPSTG